MANEGTTEIALLKCQKESSSKWLGEECNELRKGLEDKEFLMAIPSDRIRNAIRIASENLIPSQMIDVAPSVVKMGVFFRSFGVDVNDIVIEHWTRALVGKPAWAINIGIENLTSTWKWMTKLPLPNDVANAVDSVPEYANIRRAKADIEAVEYMRLLAERGAEECRRRFEAEHDKR